MWRAEQSEHAAFAAAAADNARIPNAISTGCGFEWRVTREKLRTALTAATAEGCSIKSVFNEDLK